MEAFQKYQQEFVSTSIFIDAILHNDKIAIRWMCQALFSYSLYMETTYRTNHVVFLSWKSEMSMVTHASLTVCPLLIIKHHVYFYIIKIFSINLIQRTFTLIVYIIRWFMKFFIISFKKLNTWNSYWIYLMLNTSKVMLKIFSTVVGNRTVSYKIHL